MARRARFAFVVLVPAVLGTTHIARAQTTSPTVSPTGQRFPERFVGGQDLGTSTRPQNLTPLGISHDDCVQDMVLQFNVLVSGFNGSEQLQVWATKSGDCTQPTSRGVGGNAVVTCWNLGAGITPPAMSTTTSQPFNIRVQDLVGPQNLPSPQTGQYVRQGSDACSAQPTFVAVPIDIYFLPLDSGFNTVGTPYKYSIVTDLVGPNAPTGVHAGVGDTLLAVSWAPNADADTTGYDVFLDPIPGHEDASAAASAAAVDAAVDVTLVCPDTGASQAQQEASSQGGDGSMEGGDGSASDATGSNAFAGCVTTVASGGGGTSAPTGGDNCNNSCTSTVLVGGVAQDGGTVTPMDDAGNPIEGGVVSGSGGLSTIDPRYIVNANATTGVTVPDRNTGSYTITGLVNGMQGYTAVVAAVDGFGNVGLPSGQVCGCPALVNDFWTLYRAANGQAGGSCALEAVGKPGPALSGMVLVTALSALARRRKGNRHQRGS